MMTISTGFSRTIRCAIPLLLCLIAAPAPAQPRAAAPGQPAVSQPRQGQPVASPSKPAGGRMSKFEARRIRHACREHANERALRGGERDAFMLKCYFGRVSYRALRKECAQQGEAKGLDKGLDKAILRDFVRECVRERARQN